jgi:AraC-like DNA-binding protein
MTTDNVAPGPGGRTVTIRSFDDIAGYEQSMRLATTSMVVREAPNFSGWHARIDLGRVRLNSAEYAASLSTSSTVRWPRLFFLTGSGRPSRVFGRPFEHGDVTFMAEQGAVSMVSDRHMAWTSIEFHPDVLEHDLVALDGHARDRLRHGALFAAGGTPAWRRLMDLRQAMLRAGMTDARAFESASAATAAAGTLLEAITGALTEGAPADRAASGRHFAILRRMIDAIENDHASALTLAGLCLAARTSVRTVHEISMRYLGMPAGEYLRKRRLRRVHQMLRDAPPDSMTIASAMARHGFWEIAQASAAYRAMFGQMPAETLSNAARVVVTEPGRGVPTRKRA